MATIYSKSEAQAQAEAMKALPNDIINGINQVIVNGYADGDKKVTLGCPHNVSNPQWNAIRIMLEQKGYTVKADKDHRGDGKWYTIEL